MERHVQHWYQQGIALIKKTDRAQAQTALETEASVLILLQIPATVPTVSIRTTEERPTVPPVVLINLTLAVPTAGISVKEVALTGQLRAHLDHL